MEKEKRKYLETKFGIASVIFTLCICVAMGAIGFAIYCKGIKQQNQKYISGILNIAEKKLDADDLAQCLEKKQQSEKYNESQKFLDEIKNSYDIEYIYIIKPLKESGTDNMVYLMAGVSEEEKDDPDNVVIGDLSGSEYDEKVTKYYIDAMSNDKTMYYANKTSFGYMYSGLRAIKDSNGNEVAVLAVDMSMNYIQSIFFEYVKLVAIVGSVAAIIFGINLFLWVRTIIIKPIKKMEHSVNAFIEDGHAGVELSKLTYEDPKIHSGDEMQVLSEDLIELTDALKRYMGRLMTETKEKERIVSELNIATQIQANMLPCIFPPFPNRTEFDIFASMDPAKEVGGDFYDFFLLDENHLAVVMADVSGKGVPAALFMVIGKTLIKDYSGLEGSLGDVFTKVNDMLCESNKEELFITAFEGVIDLTTGELEFVNAGHEKPIIYHKEENRWEVYPTKAGFVLAGMEGMRYRSATLNLKKGDRIFLYTDGIPEAINAQNEQYGMNRLVQELERNSQSSCNELIGNVRKDVERFADGAEQFDDITMLCVEYNEEA